MKLQYTYDNYYNVRQILIIYLIFTIIMTLLYFSTLFIGSKFIDDIFIVFKMFYYILIAFMVISNIFMILVIVTIVFDYYIISQNRKILKKGIKVSSEIYGLNTRHLPYHNYIISSYQLLVATDKGNHIVKDILNNDNYQHLSEFFADSYHKKVNINLFFLNNKFYADLSSIKIAN